MKTALIVGGTSGLGLALAQTLVEQKYLVFITGQSKVVGDGMIYLPLTINENIESVRNDLDALIESILGVSKINLFIYAVGFTQLGKIDALADAQITTMAHASLAVPAMLYQRILSQQEILPESILITSSSAWTPRLEEPMYAATKAGLHMLGLSLAEDPRIKKMLIVGPTGMNTKMQRGRKYEGSLLEPRWVAEKTLEHLRAEFKCKQIQVLRDPPRINVTETR